MNDRTKTILFIVFGLSGATALVYEIVWARMLGLVFGNTVYAGSVLREMERYPEAIAEFEIALGLDPDRVTALNNLGLTYQRIENIDAALEVYKRSLYLEPNQTNIAQFVQQLER